MAQWVNSINQVAEAGASGSASGGRAQTLPAGTLLNLSKLVKKSQISLNLSKIGHDISELAYFFQIGLNLFTLV